MNGAEILLRPNAWIEPQMEEPTDLMAVCTRYNAFANMCYVVESTGDTILVKPGLRS